MVDDFVAARGRRRSAWPGSPSWSSGTRWPATQARVGRREEVLVEGPSKKDAAVLSGRTRQSKLVHFVDPTDALRAGRRRPRRRHRAPRPHHLAGTWVERTGEAAPGPHPDPGPRRVTAGPARRVVRRVRPPPPRARRPHRLRQVGARARAGRSGAATSSSSRSTRCRCTGAWTSAPRRPRPRSGPRCATTWSTSPTRGRRGRSPGPRPGRAPRSPTSRPAGSRAVLVGGTGLYVRAVVDGLALPGRGPRAAGRARGGGGRRPAACPPAGRARRASIRGRGTHRAGATSAGWCGRSRWCARPGGRSRRRGRARRLRPAPARRRPRGGVAAPRPSWPSDRGAGRGHGRRRVASTRSGRCSRRRARCRAPRPRRSATGRLSPRRPGSGRSPRRSADRRPHPAVRPTPAGLVPPGPPHHVGRRRREPAPRTPRPWPAGHAVSTTRGNVTRQAPRDRQRLPRRRRPGRRRREPRRPRRRWPRALCDRHRGVGADGFIRSCPGRDGADLSMVLRNADGSEAEISGNGVRCLGLGRRRRAARSPDTFTVATGGGVRTRRPSSGATTARSPGERRHGPATLDPGSSRSRAERPAGSSSRSTAPATRATPSAWATPTSCSTCRPRPRSTRCPSSAHGPVLEHDPRFPRRTNVHFAAVTGPDRLRLRIWERGAGATLSCGSGACAAAVSAHGAGSWATGSRSRCRAASSRWSWATRPAGRARRPRVRPRRRRAPARESSA